MQPADYRPDCTLRQSIYANIKETIIPASLNRSNAARYGKDVPVDFKEFPGRTHFVLGQPGWEEVAAYGAGVVEGEGIVD